MTGIYSARIGSLLQPALRSAIKQQSRSICIDYKPLRKKSDGSDCSKGKMSQEEINACDRICMPCCKPARFPPACFFPFIKPPCKLLKPPRPAYSECAKDPICPIRPCDCCPPKPPKCVLLPKSKKKGRKK